MPEETQRYICEVLNLEGREALRVRVRLAHGKIAEFSLPVAFCPPVACIPGGAFYLEIKGVNPELEEAELKRLLG